MQHEVMQTTSPPRASRVAVLDSSVLVALWSRIVLQRLAERTPPLYVPLWSEWIVGETWRTLAWRWLNRAAHPDELEWQSLTTAANAMMRRLLRVVQMVSLQGYDGPDAWPQLRDPDDVPIWHTAVRGGAGYVVSQNTRDFPPLVDGRHTYADVEYLTAIEFVEDLLGEDASAVYEAPLPAGAHLRSGRVA